MVKMNPALVTLRLTAIAALAHDSKAAHVAEDHLFMDVLQAIAEQACESAAECARLALESLKIDFDRWRYA